MRSPLIIWRKLSPTSKLDLQKYFFPKSWRIHPPQGSLRGIRMRHPCMPLKMAKNGNTRIWIVFFFVWNLNDYFKIELNSTSFQTIQFGTFQIFFHFFQFFFGFFFGFFFEFFFCLFLKKYLTEFKKKKFKFSILGQLTQTKAAPVPNSATNKATIGNLVAFQQPPGANGTTGNGIFYDAEFASKSTNSKNFGGNLFVDDDFAAKSST